MITLDTYLRFCDEALDAYAACARELGDPLVNASVPSVEGSNSAFALVSHVVGVMGRWGRTVNRGIVVPRDRDAEFTATGTVDEALALLESGRGRLHEDVRVTDPGAPPVNPPQGRDGTAYETQGEVLLHVYEELAQHLGQLEVTRDVLLATARQD
ncbi:DinB family protein [Knoellia locipacati]|uniref:mycothiol transferase n=1 Tax=Knoellia locipacati TaxID=882824 RepID=UPI00384E3415